jgi:predicted nucleotidyltransferase component of viral defense system
MLREETVEPATLELLKQLVALPALKNFRLVGGTALSLLLGHRKSIDLDFFTDQPLEKQILKEALVNSFNHIETVNDISASIYQCFIQNIKVDFVSVKDSFSKPIQFINEIPFADIEDLVALKLNAVKGRGVKKDFWDIARLLQLYSFEELFQFYNNRYPYDDPIAVLRSAIYFDDAENSPEPRALDGATWNTVKENIVKAFHAYYH